eukprot:gb/GECG01002924.1/.p1 GENE.gb/GECG01002924.1/~~gb/GECG01002924.1/.p1  ORF type:complete len:432 (+),score=53.14 gb/GECG01002924.1/:1-1296(+)
MTVNCMTMTMCCFSFLLSSFRGVAVMRRIASTACRLPARDKLCRVCTSRVGALNAFRTPIAHSAWRNMKIGIRNVSSSVLPEQEEGMTEQTAKLAEGIKQGNRSSLSRAITLIESTRRDHRRQAELLLDEVLAARRQREATASAEEAKNKIGKTLRVGIAGSPGAGKSTFIEGLGTYLTEKCGYKVAVIAVDPSSNRTGGSILGDKTRMAQLSNNPNAYVRPSPTRGTLGGIAEHTHDVVLLCEGTGYDIVLVETVGLGQSEVAIDSTVDMLLLLVSPGGGDELQGVKKGIMESADLIVVNKADGALVPTARHTASEYRRALDLLRPKHQCWRPMVRRCSAHERSGLTEVWAVVEKFWQTMLDHGEFQDRRVSQGSEWMWSEFESQLRQIGKSDPRITAKAEELKQQLGAGLITPRRAGTQLVEILLTVEG